MPLQLSKFKLPSPGSLLNSLCDSCVEWNNDVVELDFPHSLCGHVCLEEKEQQTGGGCSGGRLRNTTHCIRFWIFNDKEVGGKLEEVWK
jgi:hypothetical protein